MRFLTTISERLAKRLHRVRLHVAKVKLHRAAAARDAGAAAALIPGFIRVVRGCRVPTGEMRRRVRILGLEKVGFAPDIQMVCEGWSEAELHFLHRGAIKAIAAAFLPQEIDDNNYLGAAGAAGDAAKAEYRRFLKQLWPKVQQITGGFNVVATGNFGYYAEREFAAAVHACRTPFVVLQKENLKTPGLAQFWEKVYRERRGRFEGTRIFTYNQIERQIQIDAGVIDAERVEVCGMPRLDSAHRLRERAAPPAPRPTFLFFDFSERVGLPSLARKDRGAGERRMTFEEGFASGTNLRWTMLWRGCRQVMLSLARRNPSCRFVIKTKASKMEMESLRRFLSSSGTLPKNIDIVSGGDPLDLIGESWVVSGFNSTALLEALAAGRPVIVPGFAEASAETHRSFVLDLLGAARVAADTTEYAALIEAHLRGSGTGVRSDRLPASTVRALDLWCGNADGCASARLRGAIEKLLD